MQGDSLSPRGGKFGMRTRRSAAAIVEAVDSLPLTLGVLETARYLGLGRTTAYALIAAGKLPVPVLRVGRSYRVPTAPLLELLGLSTPAADDNPPHIANPHQSPVLSMPAECRVDGIPVGIARPDTASRDSAAAKPMHCSCGGR